MYERYFQEANLNWLKISRNKFYNYESCVFATYVLFLSLCY